MRTIWLKAGATLLLLLIAHGIGHAQSWSSPIFIDSVGKNIGIDFQDSSVGYAWNAQPYLYTPYFDAKLHFFRTSDGGNTWASVLHSVPVPGDTIFQDIFSPLIFVSCPGSESIFIVTGSGLTLHSNDSTHIWETSSPGHKITFGGMFSQTRGVFTSDAETYITTDTANTLTEDRSGGDYGQYLSNTLNKFCADWSDSLHWYYAVSYNYNDTTTLDPIVITSDGGRNWTNIFPDTVSRNLHYKQVSSLRGTPYSAVLTGDSINSIYYTNDWGATWHPTSSAFPQLMKRIVLVAPNELWAIANVSTGADSIRTQYILHSVDTGHSWSVDSTSIKGFRAADLAFSDPGHGWIAMNKIESGGIDTMLYVTRYTNGVASVHTENYFWCSAKSLASYPNPSERYVHISLPFGDTPNEIIVSDYMGQTFAVPNKIEGAITVLDLNTLASGIYYIKLSTPSGRTYRARVTKLP